MTVGTWIEDTFQYLGLYWRVTFCGVKFDSVYGPVPTGLASAYLLGSPTDCQTCCATIC